MPDVTTAPAVKTVPAPRDPHLRDMAYCIRFLSMDAVQKAQSGHPGAPMGIADIATVLFRDFMSFDAADPHWFDRDRFLLLNGHGSMLLYSLLYLTGVQDMTLGEIERFRQIDSKTAGQPECKHADGIEATTGPLGQCIANAVGLALAERILNAKFGDDVCKHWTYVFMGDGCLRGRHQPGSHLHGRPLQTRSPDGLLGQQLDLDRRRDQPSQIWFGSRSRYFPKKHPPLSPGVRRGELRNERRQEDASGKGNAWPRGAGCRSDF